MEQAAELEASGQFTNNEIARLLGVSLPTLHVMKSQPEYLAKRAELTTGVISHLSSTLRSDTDNLRRELSDLLPSALRVLRNAVQRGAKRDASIHELKIGMEAGKQIMDREATFSIVSKSQVTIKDAPDLAKEERTENDLLALLQEAQKQRESSEKQEDGTVKAVSKQQQSISLEAFISSAGDKDAQERMKQFIKLEDFDEKSLPRQ
jgi:hypothetical protein